MRNFLLITLAVLLVTSAGLLGAEEWWEEEQSPLVQRQETADSKWLTNWEDGYIQVTGVGTADMATAPNVVEALKTAEDAARVRAHAQLAEIILGLRIAPEITVAKGLVEGSEQRVKLEGFIKGARESATDYEWADDGSPIVKVTVAVVMGKRHSGMDAPAPTPPPPDAAPTALSQVVMPAVQEMEKTPRFEAYEVPAQLPPRPPGAAAREVKDYTALIVDGSELGGLPSVSPKLLTPGGKEVWGTLVVTPEYASEYGIAGWAHNLDKARESLRVGPEPLIIRALTARGLSEEDPIKTYFVISEEDAAFVQAMNERTHFLERAGVVIVD